MIENKKVLILGMARSGYEASKFLHKYNNDIIITDLKEQDSNHIEELKKLNIDFILTDKPEDLLDATYDYVVKNPGIRKDHPCVLKARKLNIPVINEVEVAYMHLNKKVTIIGVTGSNGKTTTTSIIYEMLNRGSHKVYLGGNIGFPVTSIIDKLEDGDILLLEISDHQLVDMYTFKTHISVLTNLSPVHLDFHESYDVYKNTKKKIFENHTKDDIAIINYDNLDSMQLTEDIKSCKQYFSTTKAKDCYIKDDSIYYKDTKVIALKDIKIKGKHNIENAMCAIMVALENNISLNDIVDVLKTFKGVEHRIEYVKTLGGIEFYNDSKSTNCASTIIALKSFTKPTILILGGLDRGHSFEDLNDYVEHVKAIVCYGQTKMRINKWATDLKIPTYICDNLEEATFTSYDIATKDDVVLLSPACASWDQFKDFEVRGNKFKETVNSLK